MLHRLHSQAGFVSTQGKHDRRASNLRLATPSKGSQQQATKAPQAASLVKLQLDSALAQLGTVAALLPGSPTEKAVIDKLILQLEQSSSTPQDCGALLPGDWQLVYTSNGTVVTRTILARLLLAASSLPGVGLSDIQQTLSPPEASGALQTCNKALFGLGPFGSWQMAIEGRWRPAVAGDLSVVEVVFDGFKLKLVGLLGLRFPVALPEVALDLGGRTAPAAAEWFTPYVDDEWRIGRGRKTGNTFLFRRMRS